MSALRSTHAARTLAAALVLVLAAPVRAAVLPSAHALAPSNASRSADAPALPRALVASEALARGDVDAWMEEVVALLLAEPRAGSPYAELALRALARRASDLADPRTWPATLARLEGARSLDLHARAYLARLATEERVARADGAEIERLAKEDAYPEHLASFRFLAPLDRLDATELAALCADPGFDRAHAGLRGMPVRWQTGRRENLRPEVSPAEWIEPVEGWMLLAFDFDVPPAHDRAPAAIEIDTHGSYALRAIGFAAGQNRPWPSAIGDPTWSFSVDGAQPVTIDAVAKETPPVVLAPCTLRAGRMRVVLACRASAYPSFAVRVLVPDGGDLARGGWPLRLGSPDLSRNAPAPEPLPAPAETRVATLDERLEAMPDRDEPLVLAARGVELCDDLRPVAGLALLARAHERTRGDATRDAWSIAAAYARELAQTPYLPEVHRRARARTIFEAIATSGAKRLDVEIELAHTEIAEDREELAFARLERARADFPKSTEPLLALARSYPNLRLDVDAERARDAALELAPHSASALALAADALAEDDLHARAAELRRRIVASLGAYTGNLQALHHELAASGDAEGALRALEAARPRAGHMGYVREIADLHQRQERHDAADALWKRFADAYPRWEEPLLKRAELARLRGDAKAEAEHLRAALARAPASWPARQGLAALGVPDRTEALFARFAADRAAVLASYDAKRWKDSVVRVLDSQVLRVFADGSTESVTHDLVQVKDLEGCNREGTQRIPGEVERLVTIKADGTELEPVEVDGEFVMPSLKPGDYVERVFRRRDGAPEEGTTDLGSWSFASVDEPFHVSRYVVILPRGHRFELALRRFDGTHEVIVDGDEEIHVFEAKDRERLEHEPGAPPPQWVLPSVRFGIREDALADARRDLFEPTRLATRVTPEIEAAAASATEDLADEEAKAKALHAFVRRTVKQVNPRSASSAVATLLQEEGNATHLYAALLASAGIEHELAWSRDAAPESDPEPLDDPERSDPFPDASRWQRRLFVVVRPKGAAEAWCDLAFRDLPYGVTLGNAPRAEVVTRSGMVRRPDVPLEERVGSAALAGKVALAFDVHDDGGADVSVRIEPTGNVGYAIKDNLRPLTDAQRKAAFGQQFASIVPGFELAELDPMALESDEPLVFSGRGRVRKLVDVEGGAATLKLPLPALELTQSYAGGEGERNLEYFRPDAIVTISEARITLPEGMRLAEAPPATRAEWLEGRYVLAIEREEGSERTFTVKRELLLPPFRIPPAEYPRFAQFCAEVDAVERVPLRFER